MSPTPPPNRPDAPQRALQEEMASLADVVGPAPLVDMLLERCFELGSTDVHFDPQTDGMHVRLRLDGSLHDVFTIQPTLAPQVVSRIKLMADMDITERRIAQDGHISSAMLRRQRDIRVGSSPTIHGERLVLRLMPDSSRFSSLAELGLEEGQVELIERALNSPHGVVLSVGPVGCGKSTTTYTCLDRLNDPTRSLVSIEDPVERRMDGVNQVQVDPKIDFGFVEALRGVLRQDPDVIMVGEIRDAETARIAIRAGLTGTRVLSTLHAGDTGAALDMFRQFEVPRLFVADAVNCIIAQRLVRKVCEKSRENYQPDAATCQLLRLDPQQCRDVRLVRGVPSDANFQTGYFGRTGIFEVLFVDAPVREAILEAGNGMAVAEVAKEHGLKTLEEAAIRKVLEGITSVEEMHRVLTVY